MPQTITHDEARLMRLRRELHAACLPIEGDWSVQHVRIPIPRGHGNHPQVESVVIELLRGLTREARQTLADELLREA